jgi:hypothetical protein
MPEILQFNACRDCQETIPARSWAPVLEWLVEVEGEQPTGEDARDRGVLSLNRAPKGQAAWALVADIRPMASEGGGQDLG